MEGVMAVAATNTRAADSSVDPELAARDWIYENGATVCDKWARHGKCSRGKQCPGEHRPLGKNEVPPLCYDYNVKKDGCKRPMCRLRHEKRKAQLTKQSVVEKIQTNQAERSLFPHEKKILSAHAAKEAAAKEAAAADLAARELAAKELSKVHPSSDAASTSGTENHSSSSLPSLGTGIDRIGSASPDSQEEGGVSLEGGSPNLQSHSARNVPTDMVTKPSYGRKEPVLSSRAQGKQPMKLDVANFVRTPVTTACKPVGPYIPRNPTLPEPLSLRSHRTLRARNTSPLLSSAIAATEEKRASGQNASPTEKERPVALRRIANTPEEITNALNTLEASLKAYNSSSKNKTEAGVTSSEDSPEQETQKTGASGTHYGGLETANSSSSTGEVRTLQSRDPAPFVSQHRLVGELLQSNQPQVQSNQLQVQSIQLQIFKSNGFHRPYRQNRVLTLEDCWSQRRCFNCWSATHYSMAYCPESTTTLISKELKRQSLGVINRRWTEIVLLDRNVWFMHQMDAYTIHINLTALWSPGRYPEARAPAYTQEQINTMFHMRNPASRAPGFAQAPAQNRVPNFIEAANTRAAEGFEATRAPEPVRADQSVSPFRNATTRQSIAAAGVSRNDSPVEPTTSVEGYGTHEPSDEMTGSSDTSQAANSRTLARASTLPAPSSSESGPVTAAFSPNTEESLPLTSEIEANERAVIRHEDSGLSEEQLWCWNCQEFGHSFQRSCTKKPSRPLPPGGVPNNFHRAEPAVPANVVPNSGELMLHSRRPRGRRGGANRGKGLRFWDNSLDIDFDPDSPILIRSAEDKLKKPIKNLHEAGLDIYTTTIRTVDTNVYTHTRKTLKLLGSLEKNARVAARHRAEPEEFELHMGVWHANNYKYRGKVGRLQTLPFELLEKIFIAAGGDSPGFMISKGVILGDTFETARMGTLPRFQNLKGLMVLCRVFRDVTRKIIYRYIGLERWTSIQQFIKTVNEKPELAELVHVVKIALPKPHPNNKDYYDITPHRDIVGSLVITLIESCRNVQLLSLELPHALYGFGCLQMHLPQLREVQVHDWENISMVLPRLWKNLAFTPELTSFRIRHSYGNDSVDFEPLALPLNNMNFMLRRLPMGLKSLTLDYCAEISDPILEAMTAQLNQLEKLVLINCKLVTTIGFANAVQNMGTRARHIMLTLWQDGAGKPVKRDLERYAEIYDGTHLCEVVRNAAPHLEFLGLKVFKICDRFMEDDIVYDNLHTFQLSMYQYRHCMAKVHAVASEGKFYNTFRAAALARKFPKMNWMGGNFKLKLMREGHGFQVEDLY